MDFLRFNPVDSAGSRIGHGRLWHPNRSLRSVRLCGRCICCFRLCGVCGQCVGSTREPVCFILAAGSEVNVRSTRVSLGEQPSCIPCAAYNHWPGCLRMEGQVVSGTQSIHELGRAEWATYYCEWPAAGLRARRMNENRSHATYIDGVTQWGAWQKWCNTNAV